MRRCISFRLLVVSGATIAWAGSLGAGTEEALLRALEDERASAAFYGAVIASQGEVRPFTNIVHAEVRQ